MLIFKLAGWLQRRLGHKSEIYCKETWDNIYDWESAHSNDGEPSETDLNLELLDQALAIEETDPEAAFHIYQRAAEDGSALALRRMGWHYEWGKSVEADHEVARGYYHRAICAGSWLATIPYARLLADDGHCETSEAVLQDGVDADFIPACFWLARLRMRQSKSRRTYRETGPLLEHASERGHPGARLLLAVFMLSGKFGFRRVPAGFRMIWESLEDDKDEEQPGDGAASRPFAA